MVKTEFPKVPVQFIKFAIVGLGSNLILYCIYLSITYLGISPKYAMTFLYILGVAQTFIFNKKWTFQHLGTTKIVFSRYVRVYLFGYIFNLSILYIMVDHLGFSHQIVQGCVIIFLAFVLFILQKFWVFK